jgi:hypothetical protein
MHGLAGGLQLARPAALSGTGQVAGTCATGTVRGV